MSIENCNSCSKKLYKTSQLKCDCCSNKFHFNCFSQNDKSVSKSPLVWLCTHCNVFPFFSLTNLEMQDLYFNPRSHNNKMKCFGCNGKIKRNTRYKNCLQCQDPHHIKCSTKSTNNWTCSKCILSELPFYKTTNDDFLSNLLGLDDSSIEFLKNVPSFNIKTLLDSLPGENFEKDDFVTNTISSKYYSPIELRQTKFNRKHLSMAHLNIASLQLHIEELKSLLVILDKPLDIIAITETRLHHQEVPKIDITIPGYDFYHTDTYTSKGGAGIYVKSTFECTVNKELSVSIENVCESMFIELKNKRNKNILIGSIYRHHSTIKEFRTQYMDKTLKKILRSKKTVAILGDFNINLLDYSKHNEISEYYDNLSSSGFRPLVLQPTRVTSKSATLIDNIFINDLTCFSNGGNIVTSISDHYMQFCKLDIFDTGNEQSKDRKSVRNWRIFNEREFSDELSKIEWDNLLNDQMDTNKSSITFFNTITKLLDEMAPFRKITKKEIKLKQHPWISQGILTSMKKRDKLYKDFLQERNNTARESLHAKYKQYRNMIINLIRKSKRKYYFDFFTEHNSNIKKT